MTTTAKRLGIPLVVMIVALVLWLAASRDAGRTASTEGTLSFRNVRSVSAPEGSGTQTFQLETVWDGTTFPGVRACTFKAVDAQGDVVGQRTETFYTMMPVSPITFDVPVDRKAVDLQSSCGERLDAGGPYAYGFSNVTVGPVEHDSYEPGTVQVTYDAEWLGTGKPGIATCTLKVIDAAGSVLHSEQSDFLLASGHAQGHEWNVTDPVFESSAPTAATISDCNPFEYHP